MCNNLQYMFTFQKGKFLKRQAQVTSYRHYYLSTFNYLALVKQRDLSLRLSLSCYFVAVHFPFASPPFNRQPRRLSWFRITNTYMSY